MFRKITLGKKHPPSLSGRFYTILDGGGEIRNCARYKNYIFLLQTASSPNWGEEEDGSR